MGYVYEVDPLSIIVQGFLSGNPLDIIVQGFFTTTLEEEIIEEDIVVGGGAGAAGGWDEPWNPWIQKKKKKKITAKVYIEDKQYTQSIITEDLTVDIKDVKLEINQKIEGLQIKIILPNKD